jgi:ABC-type uncharacterized transport system involved in gliding motility auxiliary subunit
LLLVLLFANALLARASVRMDLTEEGLYTLSDGSKKILSGLEDPASIKVFWHNVPLRFDHTKRYVAALLEEMETASDGKVRAQWVDMSEDAGLEQATEIGLTEHTFSVRHGSEFRQARGYMSLVIEIGDAPPEKINALANITDKLEYRIVSSIFKGQRTSPPIIGLVHHMPFNPMGGGRGQSNFAYLQQELQLAFGSALRGYVSLDQPVAEDIDVLIVADPRDFTDKQVFRFEQFLLRGGRAILLLDPLDLNAVLGRGVQVVRANTTGFEDWLAHLGVTVEKGCVVDFNENASCLYPQDRIDRMGRRIGRDWVRYAHWPKVLPDFTDPTNPVMRYLRPMAMYWPAALSIDQEAQEKAGRTVTVLATTTAEGHRRTDVTNVREAGFSPEGKLLEKVPLIALVEGPATSFWAGKDDPTVPKPEPKPDEPNDGEPKDGEPKGDEPKDEKADESKGGDEKAPEDKEASGSPDGDGPDEPAPVPEGPKKPDPDKDGPKQPAPKKDAPKQPAPKKDAAPGGDGGDGGEGDDPQDAAGDATDEDADEEAGPKRLEQGNVRFVVLGDADLVGNSFNPQTFLTQINGASGFAFVHNMADWLSGSEDLMALRSRATNPRNLEQLEEGERDLLKHVNLLLVPLLVLLAGMTVFIVRRS